MVVVLEVWGLLLEHLVGIRGRGRVGVRGRGWVGVRGRDRVGVRGRGRVRVSSLSTSELVASSLTRRCESGGVGVG